MVVRKVGGVGAESCLRVGRLRLGAERTFLAGHCRLQRVKAMR